MTDETQRVRPNSEPIAEERVDGGCVVHTFRVAVDDIDPTVRAVNWELLGADPEDVASALRHISTVRTEQDGDHAISACGGAADETRVTVDNHRIVHGNDARRAD